MVVGNYVVINVKKLTAMLVRGSRKPRPGGRTHLSVVFDVESERDETRLELLRVESSRARLVEVQERPAELLELLVADALRVARQDLNVASRTHGNAQLPCTISHAESRRAAILVYSMKPKI